VPRRVARHERLPGRHLYFLDDHLLGNGRFAAALFDGMRGMGRVWQAAATVDSVLRGDLVERAADAGLRSLFVGFETLDDTTLRLANKRQNLGRDYSRAIRRLDDLGVMVNGSFVFGLDGHGPDVFDRTVDWAVAQGVTTATFHIATPYPGTAFFRTIEGQGRLLHRDWDRYDTRHVVFKPLGMAPATLEAGYWRAYRSFYSWPNLLRGSRNHDRMAARRAPPGVCRRLEAAGAVVGPGHQGTPSDTDATGARDRAVDPGCGARPQPGTGSHRRPPDAHGRRVRSARTTSRRRCPRRPRRPPTRIAALTRIAVRGSSR
jgi:hypothetical protein